MGVGGLIETDVDAHHLASGKQTKHYGKWPSIVDLPIKNGDLQKTDGKSQYLLDNSTISMAIFNSYVSLPEGNHCTPLLRCDQVKPLLE